MCDATLVRAVSSILYGADPISLIPDVGREEVGEYDAEAAAIVGLLPACHTKDDLQERIWVVFRNYFSVDAAGSESDYAEIAERIWSTWHQYRKEAGEVR